MLSGADQAGAVAMAAPKYARVITPSLLAAKLTATDKVVLGLRSTVSLNSLAGVVVGAGYSHLTDGQPNFGVNSTAFGQRFGAGVARSASADIFRISIMAPLLHQDPRYYILGSRSRFFKRIIYAATRPVITRTDGGRQTLNASMLLGYAGSSALTRVYCPSVNRNFKDTARSFGSSLGGAVLSFELDEFSDQILKAIHLRH